MTATDAALGEAGESQAAEESEAAEAAEVESTQAGESQPEGADDAEAGGEEAGAGEGGEAAQDEEAPTEPFRHTIPYKAAGEDKTFDIAYDAKGNILPESLDEIVSVLSKQGLEKTAQSAREDQKRAERELNAERVRADQARRQLEQLEEAYAPVVSFFNDNPNVVTALKQNKFEVPTLPDQDKLRLQRENDALLSEQNIQRGQQITAEQNRKLIERNPGLTQDDADMINLEVASRFGNSITSMLPQGGTSEQVMTAYDGIVDTVYKAMIADGKMPNPQLEKANKQTAAVAKELERAKQVQAVKNPMAGGGGAVAQKGRKTKDPFEGVIDRQEATQIAVRELKKLQAK